MASAPPKASRIPRACCFRLAGEAFAVEIPYAKEVVAIEDYTLVPGAPAHVLGVANLRGAVTPVLDVQPFLGFPPRQAGGRIQALVIGEHSPQVAVAIDEVLGLASFEEVLPLEEPARSAYGDLGSGLVRQEGRPVTLLNAPKILEALRPRPRGAPAVGERTVDPGGRRIW